MGKIVLLLEHQQDFVLYLLWNFNTACLQTVCPCVNLFGLHGVEHMAELLNIGFGVILLFCAFETVEFLIFKVEVAVVVSFGAVRMLSATLSILTFVAVVVVGYNSVAI